MEKKIQDVVIAAIADQLSKKKSEVQEASTLEELGADSLDRVEIVMKLEEDLNVEIDDEEADDLTSVGSWVKYLTTLTKQ